MAVTLKDALRICHPKPKDEKQAEIFKKIREGTLEVPETWETYISVNGSNTETWTHIAPKLPIFALVRNLRNLLKFDVDTSLYINKLRDPKVIHNSKMFPFRFQSAYKMIQMESATPKQRSILDALEDSMDISADNIETIPGTTAIFTDLSGSMSSRLSAKSMVQYVDISSLFGAIADKICEQSIVGGFGQTFATIDVPKRSPILSKMQVIRNTNVGHSTNGYLAVDYLAQNDIDVDRIIIFSDEQLWDSRWSNRTVQEAVVEYRRKVNSNTFLHSIDLAGYSTTIIPPNDPQSNLIGGWTDKVLDYIGMFEDGTGSMIKAVEDYTVV